MTLDESVYSITPLGEIADLFTRAYPDKPFEEAQRVAYRIADRLADTGPERDLAEQALEKLERLAREYESAIVYIRHDLRLEVWQHKGPDMEYRYQRQYMGVPTRETNVARAEALALLKGAKE